MDKETEACLDERMHLIAFLVEKKLLWEFMDWTSKKTPAELTAMVEGDHFLVERPEVDD